MFLLIIYLNKNYQKYLIFKYLSCSYNVVSLMGKFSMGYKKLSVNINSIEKMIFYFIVN